MIEEASGCVAGDGIERPHLAMLGLRNPGNTRIHDRRSVLLPQAAFFPRSGRRDVLPVPPLRVACFVTAQGVFKRAAPPETPCVKGSLRRGCFAVL